MRERQPGIYQENHAESTYSGEDGMDRKCSKCGGDLIEGALLDGLSFHSVIYTPLEELTKIKKIKTGVICDACAQCGCIENLRVEDPSQLRRSKSIPHD